VIPLAPPLRLARAGDAPVLARLLDYAGEGLLLYAWTQMAEPGQDPWDYGAQRQAEKVAKGWVIVVDEGNGPIAGLTGYAIGAEPGSLDGLPAVFVPLQELWNLALRTWYVNMLAALPEARGRGLGTRLLGLADEIARDQGLSRLSLIVADSNAGARRLYARHGYAETARRTMVKESWQSHGTDWLLLIKDIGAR
jgi:ribosomal protein S18 acetylase RimI-like enzyme